METRTALAVRFALMVAVAASAEPPLGDDLVLQEFGQWNRQIDRAAGSGGTSVNADDWKRRALNAVEDVAQRRDLNCSAASPSFAETLGPGLRDRFSPQTRTLTPFVIFLQNVLDARGGGAGIGGPFYASLARSVVQSDAAIHGCALYLEGDVSENFPVYAYRNGTEIETCPARSPGAGVPSDARNGSEGDGGAIPSPSCAVADELTVGGGRPPLWRIVDDRERSSANGTRRPETRGDWSAPWYVCGHATWIAAYSVPVIGVRRWRGVVVITVDLGAIDVNQCAQNDDGLFGDTHLCHRETMQCIHHAGRGFRRGAYGCVCRPGYYFPNSSDAAFLDGGVLEATYGESPADHLENLYRDFRCLPCDSGCYECTDPSPCFVHYDVLWRGGPLGLQSFCMTITVVLGICVFRLRKCKVIATGMWTVLEMILVGALLLYSTVMIRYFEPSTLGCLLEPWFREMGFAICYGTIVLKMYRILVEFRTRKAHRWVIRDKDLLKYLAGIILVVIGYMSAWTAISVDHIREGDNIVDLGETEDGLKFYVCKSRWWDYVTEVGEFSFLLFGIYISYHIKNAISAYKEKRHLCLAIYIEALVSLLLYVFRHHVWLTLHPDYIFLMYFARCQFTVSITLILIFGPKLWYHYKPPREGETDHGRTTEGQDHVAPEVLKLQDGITSNGEVDIGEINLADMDPEDIRSELRRVYTQLQILRNKTMRKDNPHISKRRGGRKATHRRFSLQAFHRHRHHHDQDHETEISKTPEESTGSADAGAQVSDSNEATGGSNATGAKKGVPAQQ